jgi:hypothetical protein
MSAPRRNRRRTPWWARPQVRAMTFFGAAAVVLWAKPMGLLLWARLRILANIPRTAIADDEALAAAVEDATPIPSLGEPMVVVLPRAPSSNPFADSSASAVDGPRQSDIPHKPTANSGPGGVDDAAREKSSGKTTEENTSGRSDGANPTDAP